MGFLLNDFFYFLFFGDEFMPVCVRLIQVGASINRISQYNGNLLTLLFRIKKYDECLKFLDFREKYEKYMDINPSQTPTNCKLDLDCTFEKTNIFNEIKKQKDLNSRNESLNRSVNEVKAKIFEYINKYEPEKLDYYIQMSK